MLFLPAYTRALTSIGLFTWGILIVKVLSVSQLINSALREKAAETMKKNCRHLLMACFKDMMKKYSAFIICHQENSLHLKPHELP